jgi:hypothetical protein
LLLAPGYFLLRNGLFGSRGLLGAAGKSLGGAGGASGGILHSNVSAQQQIESQLPHGAKSLLSQHYSTAMQTAGRAVLITFGTTATLVLIYQTSLNSAFLTDFPFNESEINKSVEKTSKYAEMKKTARIVKGVLILKTTALNVKIPFSTLHRIHRHRKPKEDFSLQINNITDQIKFKQSKKRLKKVVNPYPPYQHKKSRFCLLQKIIKTIKPSLKSHSTTWSFNTTKTKLCTSQRQ